jgi:hypothetical protein
MVGAGVLSLPYAMSKLGWYVPLSSSCPGNHLYRALHMYALHILHKD